MAVKKFNKAYAPQKFWGTAKMLIDHQILQVGTELFR